MIVKGKYLIADAESAIIEDGAVRIEQDRIAAVGKYRDLKNLYPLDAEIGSDQFVVMPGLVNAHDHLRAPSALQLGIADDFVEQWLINLVGMRAVDPYLAAAFAAIQSIESGVTTVLHSYYEPDLATYQGNLDASVRAYRESGLRVALALSVLDASPVAATLKRLVPHLPSDLQAWAQKFADTRKQLPAQDFFAIFREWRQAADADPSGRISVLLGPVSVHWCSDELLTQIQVEAKATHTYVQSHVLETIYQREQAMEQYGKSAIEHLDEIGFLSPLLSCAHCVWVTEHDIELLAASGASVIHNPSSNLRLGSGIAPIRAMLAQGVNVGLGMDSASLNDDGDIFQEIRLAGLLHRVPGKDSLVPGWNEVLSMATRSGARALGRDDIGTLAPGKKADLILLKLEPILFPYTDLHSGILGVILHRARAQDVDTVIVDGKTVMQERKLVTMDKDAIVAALNDQLARGGDSRLEELRQFTDALVPHLRRLFRSQDDSSRYHFNALG